MQFTQNKRSINLSILDFKSAMLLAEAINLYAINLSILDFKYKRFYSLLE